MVTLLQDTVTLFLDPDNCVYFVTYNKDQDQGPHVFAFIFKDVSGF
jgi:hypothetical protein